MEGLLAIVGFGVGSSVGLQLTRTLGRELRPIAQGALRAGMALGDTARLTVAGLGDAISGAAAGARENLSDITAEAKLERAASKEARGNGARRIEVAKE